jgi:hypothetical protein
VVNTGFTCSKVHQDMPFLLACRRFSCYFVA